MPRQLLNVHANSRRQQQLDVQSSSKKAQQKVNPVTIERALRKHRSKRYIELMKKLDAGGHVTNQQQVNYLIAALRNELGELDESLSDSLRGIVSKCYLGDPYEVHTLDVAQCIIDHYARGERLPGTLEKVRGIAMLGGYDFIEVYDGYFCAVSDSGAVSVIRG